MNLNMFLEKIFSKAVIKSDFKKYWWVSALLGVIYMLFVARNLSYYNYEANDDFKSIFLYTDGGILPYCASFILAGILFAYLHKSGAVSFIHGMPVTRRQIYFSHILSGIVLILIPAALFSFLIYVKNGVFAVMYLGYAMTVSVLFFSIVTAVSMAVGNRVAAYLFSGAVITAPAYINTIITEFLRNNIPGYVAEGEFIEKLYIDGYNFFDNWDFLIYYLLIFVFFVVGYFLYKFRHLEKSSELLAFDWFRPVFMVIAVFYFVSFAFLVSENNWVIAFIAGAVTLGAVFMFIRKSISLRGSLRYFGIYTAVFIVISCIFHFDFLGIKSYVPSDNEIKNAYFTNKYYSGHHNRLVHTGTLKDDEISELRAFHRDVINNKNKTEKSPYKTVEMVQFEYELKSGIKVLRQFAATEITIEKYSKLFNSMAFIYSEYPSLNDELDFEITQIYYCDDMDKTKNVKISLKDNKGFIEALRKDMKNFSEKQLFSRMYIDDADYNDDILKFTIEYVSYNDYIMKDYIKINKDYENARKFLEEKGYLSDNDEIWY